MPISTLDTERSWTPIDLDAGSIVWAIKSLRGHLWSTTSWIYSDHKALENMSKVREDNARVKRWLEFLYAYYTTPWNTVKARPMAMPTSSPAFHNRPPTSTTLDPTAVPAPTPWAFISPEHAVPYEPSKLGVGLGALDPLPSSTRIPIPPLTFTACDFGEFRRHGPSMDTTRLFRPRKICVASFPDQDLAAESPCSASAGPRYV